MSVRGVRVRYVANDLSEGAVETFTEATSFTVEPDGTLILIFENGENEEDEEVIGTVPAGRWDSVVIEHETNTI